jgi:hypothetical protein
MDTEDVTQIATPPEDGAKDVAYSGRCGHLILFDVGTDSVLMWAAFVVSP